MARRMNLTCLVLSAGLTLCGCQLGESKKDNVEEREKETGMDVVEEPWPVWAVTFSPDGRWLAAGRGYRSNTKFWLGGKGEVNVWKVEDWKQQNGFSAPFTTYVQALAFTPNSMTLVAAADKYIQSDPKTGGPIVGTPDPWRGNEVFAWRIPDGAQLQSWRFDDFHGVPHNRGAGFVASLDIHPDGELLGLARKGSASVVLQRKTGHLVYEVGNNGYWQNLAFSPDGKTLAVALRSSVQLCSAGTGKELASFEPKCENPAHVQWGEHGYELVGDRLICVHYSGDGKQIAVGVSDGSVRLLAADLTKQLHSLHVSDDKEWVVGIASAPKTDILAAATPSEVRLFDTRSGKQLHEWGKEDLQAFAVALSPDGKLLAVGYGGKHKTEGERRGGFVQIWDTATGQLVKKLD